MMMNSTMNAQYQMMRNGAMANGTQTDLKRAAAMNNNRPYVSVTLAPNPQCQSLTPQQRRQPHGGHAAHEKPKHDGCQHAA